MRTKGVVLVVYLVVGILVAAARDYVDDIDGVKGIVSLVLAVVLWPLVLLGVDLHLGRDDGGKKGSALIQLVMPYLAFFPSRLGARRGKNVQTDGFRVSGT